MRGNILIVNDDPIMGNLLETRLYESGFDTEYVADPEDALKIVSEKKIDLMIFDATPLGMSVDKFYDRIKNQSKNLACIVLFSDNQPKKFLERIKTDGNDCIQKPFIMADLIKLVEKRLEFMKSKPQIETHNNHRTVLNALKQAEQDQFTGVIELSNCSMKAAVFFRFGSIVHAYHGATTGKKALYRILRDSCQVVSFQPQSVTAQTIDQQLSSLIEEGLQESAALKKLKPETFQSYIVINSDADNNLNEIKKHPSIASTISLIERLGKVQDIIDEHPLTDIQVYKQLIYLIKIGLARVEPFKQKFGIRIITDSTADLPRDLVNNHNITIIPQMISVNLDTYKDGIDIFPDEFYRLIAHTKKYPITYPPSEKEFHEVFKAIIPEYDILGIMSSDKLSKTVEHAVSAKQKYLEEYRRLRQEKSGATTLNLEIINSRTVSLGLGLLVLEACEKSQLGWDFQKITKYLESLIPEMKVFFVVESLEYLQRSKIEKIKRPFNKLFHIATILGIHQGEVVVIDKIYGQKNAQVRITEMISENLKNRSTPLKIGIMHTSNQKWAEQMSELMEMKLNCKQIIISQISPSVVSHCGIGSVGVACLPISESDIQSCWQ